MNNPFANLLLVRTAATELDLQGRFCGCLDVPLSETGLSQARTTARDLSDLDVKLIYRAPCMAAKQTAELLAAKWGAKIKIDRDLQNIDYGLWHGRTLKELKTTQPRVYKSWMEHPESVCPPGGEPISEVCRRVSEFLDRILKKYGNQKIAIVASAPVITITAAKFQAGTLSKLWSRQEADGAWFSLALQPAPTKAPANVPSAAPAPALSPGH